MDSLPPMRRTQCRRQILTARLDTMVALLLFDALAIEVNTYRIFHVTYRSHICGRSGVPNPRLVLACGIGSVIRYCGTVKVPRRDWLVLWKELFSVRVWDAGQSAGNLH